LADGDIGTHFPPSDDKWKDADSELFLNYAMQKIQNAGAKIILLDVTIICEMPKIGPERQRMKNRLAEMCNLPMNRISIKATTSEKLGFTGRKEGLSAFATATISLPLSQE
jgi:2-C-methyl-D-erythritol 4-phosphate cytidylyltransferase/2-C-methyl-D-erythritol 2,4-cyclodiphosphate synthase